MTFLRILIFLVVAGAVLLLLRWQAIRNDRIHRSDRFARPPGGRPWLRHPMGVHHRHGRIETWDDAGRVLTQARVTFPVAYVPEGRCRRWCERFGYSLPITLIPQ